MDEAGLFGVGWGGWVQGLLEEGGWEEGMGGVERLHRVDKWGTAGHAVCRGPHHRNALALYALRRNALLAAQPLLVVREVYESTLFHPLLLLTVLPLVFCPTCHTRVLWDHGQCSHSSF